MDFGSRVSGFIGGGVAGGGGTVGNLEQVTSVGNLTSNNIILDGSQLFLNDGASSKIIDGSVLGVLSGEQIFNLPDGGGIFVISVNGITADNNGNIVLSGTSSPITIQNDTSLFSTGLLNTGAGSLAVLSNFFGLEAGQYATNASDSNFLGNQAGKDATNAFNSNFFGTDAGLQADGANNSNFLGFEAGNNATDASNSNFLGQSAGFEATNANASNFIGYQAGYQATNAQFSNFIGYQAGYGATGGEEFNSNFIGFGAGYQATNANESNFLGVDAGRGATNASSSNFIGFGAGYQATDVSNSTFIGFGTGQGATNASQSIFLGSSTGGGATNAANSIFIGRSVGINDTVDNTINDLSSILIGSYSNTGGFSNSILLGSGLVGFPIANTKVNQFMLADTITDVRWRGIEYTLPATQAAVAGDVLSNDGAGVLSWASALRGLFTQTATSTPVTATTLETSLISTGLGTLTIPANGFQIGDSFSAVLIGHLSCVGTATLQIRVKTDTGILLADTGVMAMDVTTDKHWKLDVNFTIRQIGAATVAAIASGGLFAYTKNSGLNFEGVNFSVVNNTTFDTTISNTLVVTAQWNTISASDSIYTEIFTLNKSY